MRRKRKNSQGTEDPRDAQIRVVIQKLKGTITKPRKSIAAASKSGEIVCGGNFGQKRCIHSQQPSSSKDTCQNNRQSASGANGCRCPSAANPWGGSQGSQGLGCNSPVPFVALRRIREQTSRSPGIKPEQTAKRPLSHGSTRDFSTSFDGRRLGRLCVELTEAAFRAHAVVESIATLVHVPNTSGVKKASAAEALQRLHLGRVDLEVEGCTLTLTARTMKTD